MLRRMFLLAMAAVPAGEAWAQSNIMPDTSPRLPPQPGQGLPAADVRFLRDAEALSTAQAEAAQAAAGRMQDEETRRFAQALAEHHRRLAQEVSALAGQVVPGGVRSPASPPAGRVAEVLRRLEQMRGAADLDARRFLAAQLEIHPVLIEMYQTQASQTTIRELGHYAITAMVGLQEDFSTAARLGQRYGLNPPERLLSNPPQYGPGAGPTR